MNLDRALGLSFISLISVACGGGNGEGLWLFQVQVSSESTDCTTEVDYNHSDADLIEEEDDSTWDEEQTSTRSDALMVGEITMTDRGTGVLFIGDGAYPGTYTKGEWEFSWTGTQNVDSSSEHSGASYVYDYVTTYSEDKTIKMTVAGSTAEGSIKSSSSSNASYTESDEWDVDDCLSCGGQIPFGQYLVTEQETGGKFGKKGGTVEVAASNTFADDCSGSDCELDISVACPATTQKFSAMWLSTEADAADAVMDNGQEFGSVN